MKKTTAQTTYDGRVVTLTLINRGSPIYISKVSGNGMVHSGVLIENDSELWHSLMKLGCVDKMLEYYIKHEKMYAL